LKVFSVLYLKRGGGGGGGTFGLMCLRSTIPLRLIYTEEAYIQEYLIVGHEESCHFISQMLSAIDGDLAEA
jgi:hypothetical protein